MTIFIDFKDRENLNKLLSHLKQDTPALWGTFKAQTMIEHLANEVQFTNGEKQCDIVSSVENAFIEKQKWVYSDAEIPKNVVAAPPENFAKLKYKNLNKAVEVLNKELDAFEKYYQIENRTAVHPAFGALNQEEWIIWHGKHFTHHFKQFGLI